MNDPTKYTVLEADHRLAIYNEMLDFTEDMKLLWGTYAKLCEKRGISDSTVRRIRKGGISIKYVYCNENVHKRCSNCRKHVYLSENMSLFHAVDYFETPKIENPVNYLETEGVGSYKFPSFVDYQSYK